MDERRRASQAQEKGLAKRTGARMQPGSGSGPFKKHDLVGTSMEDRAVTSGTLYEAKTVLGGKRQITLKDDDLRSVAHVAAREGRLGVLCFELAGRRYVVLDENDFLEREARDGGGR